MNTRTKQSPVLRPEPNHFKELPYKQRVKVKVGTYTPEGKKHGAGTNLSAGASQKKVLKKVPLQLLLFVILSIFLFHFQRVNTFIENFHSYN